MTYLARFISRALFVVAASVSSMPVAAHDDGSKVQTDGSGDALATTAGTNPSMDHANGPTGMPAGMSVPVANAPLAIAPASHGSALPSAIGAAQPSKKQMPGFAPKEAGARQPLYYRNPMGLPDVSAAPKKDSMGMDYVPVYEGEQPKDPASVTLSPGRIQRSGVRTELAEARVVIKRVRGWGTVKYDEAKVYSVSVGVEAAVDELYVKRVGEKVKQGQPLFRLWANSPQMLQIEIARRASGTPTEQDGLLQSQLTGNAQRNPTASRTMQMNLWPSPATGVVIDKRVVAGQRVGMTDELMRIADTSTMWVIADIPERDIGHVEVGQKAEVALRAFQGEPIEGKVLFVFPGIRPETRTGRVAVEVSNLDDRIKADMFADVVIRVGAGKDPVLCVPESAVIDDGANRHILVDAGEGRFDVRVVSTGNEGSGYVEVISGLSEGERIVVSANFLIDSEANIAAALAAFSAAAVPVPKQ